MPITIDNERFDTMGDACRRLRISRQTLLRCLKDGTFTEPPTTRQGIAKYTRYFPASWYATNEARLHSLGRNAVPGQNSLGDPVLAGDQKNVVIGQNPTGGVQTGDPDKNVVAEQIPERGPGASKAESTSLEATDEDKP